MLSGKVKWPKLTIDDMRKRARILIIDDNEFYYVELFKKDEYAVEQWHDVDDLQKLESGFYDVILLDIHGVGRAHSADQGFGILKHLRQKVPTQIIVAYSNAAWNLKYQAFFDMADARLDKGADYVEFKRAVDELLERKFSFGFYVDKIIQIASPHVKDPEKVRELAIKAINKRSSDKLQNYLERNDTNIRIIQTIIQVISVAIKIATEFG